MQSVHRPYANADPHDDVPGGGYISRAISRGHVPVGLSMEAASGRGSWRNEEQPTLEPASLGAHPARSRRRPFSKQGPIARRNKTIRF